MGKRPPPEDRPWKPTKYTEQDVYAMQAVAKGIASAAQQQLALNWILEASGLRDMSFRPNERGGDRDTTFAEGKRFLGLQIAKLIEIRYRPNLPENRDGIPVGREPQE